MAYFEWKNGVEGGTPLNADNLNQMQDLIKADIDEVKLKDNVLQATTTTSLDLHTNTKIHLNSLMYKIGDKLTLDTNNYQIVIGKGVTRVEISACLFAENIQTGYIWLLIRKVGTGDVIGSLQPRGLDSGYMSISIPSSILNVEEGDRIELIADSIGGGRNRTYGKHVWINVKVIA